MSLQRMEKCLVITISYFQFDLRDIQKLDDVISLANIDLGLPTYIIAECVVIYLDLESSCSIVG